MTAAQQGKGRPCRETTGVETPDTFDGTDAPDALALSVAGAMSRQHADDSRAFLHGLASLLVSALPDDTQVERSGFWGGDKRPVRRLEVTFADKKALTRYGLEATGGQIAATRTQIVGGIALKNETIEIADWINAVSRAIVRRAEQSRATRDALQALL